MDTSKKIADLEKKILSINVLICKNRKKGKDDSYYVAQREKIKNEIRNIKNK
jgi:hypothetical protein